LDRVQLTGFARAWVGFAMDLDQLRGVYMRLSPRGAEARVPEKFPSNVGALLWQTCDDRVPRRVRADARTGLLAAT
jgi:hypothetical protein